MKIFKISARSSCGTYFVYYLQDITVMAESAEQAIESAEKWMKHTHHMFVRPKDKWLVEELKPDHFGVVDYTMDKDY